MKQPEVLVIGSGVMGRGIAKSFVSAGIPTAILSRNVANVVPGVDERVALIEKLPPNAPGLIIEAVPEKMALKLKSYAAIEAAYAGKPVLASNTSALDPEELARPLQHPDRFLGIHTGLIEQKDISGSIPTHWHNSFWCRSCTTATNRGACCRTLRRRAPRHQERQGFLRLEREGSGQSKSGGRA